VDLDLRDKVVVVTGASQGIGLAVARAFAQEGARVVAAARTSSPELDALSTEAAVVPMAVDLATPEGPATLIDRAVETFGGLDVLVNNLGAGAVRSGFLAVTDEEWQRTFDLNLFSAVRACRAALPALIARGSGAIVNLASVNSFQPDPSVVDYCVAKAAVASLSKALSMEFGPRGIRVNAVAPGPVRTPFWVGPGGVADQIAAAAGTDRDGAMKIAAAGWGGLALDNFFTEPEEVATLVLMLASERLSNVTGSTYVTDGGLLKTI
jgi:NAD(P)-dependent dehydrogenase (short-subunit alcohol dehydrogenase family)